MSTYTATIRWSRTGEGGFAKGQYSRAHQWAFDGGTVVPASASSHVVPAPWSDAAGVDPEEAFVASLSSCHMLFFLDFSRRAGFMVDSYVDEAEGVSGERQPTADDIADLHNRSHEACFIANSVTSEVTVEH
jgi:organic hydroperoxide reductase OsmC/OhrA